MLAKMSDANRRLYKAYILTSLLLSTLALVGNAMVLRHFFLDTADLAPGTEIRPMETTVYLLIIGLFAAAAGAFSCLETVLLIRRNKTWNGGLLSALTFFFSLAPLFAGWWGLDYVVGLRKLILED